MDVAKAAERLTVDDPHGWYLSETETRGRTVTRAYYWNGVELRGYPDGHFLVEMRNHRNFRGPMIVAEHPADSELAIDEPWLRSVGGVEGIAPAGNRYFDFSEPQDGAEGERTFLRLHSPFDCGGECMADLFGDGNHGVGITRKWPKTRGDLRRLAAALGIELKATQ